MRASLHPAFYEDTLVLCACGNSFVTGSTRHRLSTDVCSACHPFSTGASRALTSTGAVARFQARAAKAR